MTHVLNPIIERTDIENRRERDGIRYDPPKFFVACSCGWQAWWGSKAVAEDAWIDHISHVDRWQDE